MPTVFATNPKSETYVELAESTPSLRRWRDRVPATERRFWIGTSAAALLVAAVGMSAMSFAANALHLDLSATALGSGGNQIAVYGLLTVVVAILAALGLDGLRDITGHPVRFFAGIAVLITGLAVALPFAMTGATAGIVAAAAINLAVGLLITILIPVAATVARSAR